MMLAEIMPQPFSAAVLADDEFGLASEMNTGGRGC